MKQLLFYFLFISISTFSQINSINDSTSYYMELANFNLKNNNYNLTLENLQIAIEKAELSRNIEAKADAYSLLGNVYLELKRYSDAIETFNKSISLYQTLTPTANMAYSFYNLGVCYIGKKEFSKAENYFKDAEQIYNDLNIEGARDLINLQKSKVYKAKNEYQLASSVLNSIIAKQDIDDTYKTKAEAYYILGIIELENSRANLAVNYLNRSVELAKKYDNLEVQSNAFKALSDCYERLMDLTKSHTFLKDHLLIKDSIFSINQNKVGAEGFMSFKETERLKTIEQLDKENKEQLRATKFSKLISLLSIALISILSLLSLSLYKNNIIRSQTNKLLQDKNTELQLAKEKAENASKARSEFLSTVSHELRTPLNAINGITHLLIEEKPKKSQLQYLTSLKFSGDYLLNFINDILEINRVESENIEIERINVNVKQLLQDLQNSFKDLASKNNNDFILDIDENIPENLIGDPTKLSQIFINLINNALKFTKNGTVSVFAKIITSENENKDITRIFFDISDTGIGIPPENQEAVFESFSQGSVEINRKYGGTGLGLAIVKRLVSLLGGEIKLKSNVNVGTSFSFEIDFKIGQQTFVEIVKQYDSTVFIDKKVLVVEDNKINQMITKKMIENKEMICEIVDNGEDAISLVKKNNYDLVLMDVHLPGINGTTATEQIRKFDKSIPIIALTAISLNENREMLLSFGMNDVITKPFNPDNFYKVIAQQLS